MSNTKKVKIEIRIEIPEGYEIGCKNHLIKDGDYYYNICAKRTLKAFKDFENLSEFHIYLKPKQLTFGDLMPGDKFTPKNWGDNNIFIKIKPNYEFSAFDLTTTHLEYFKDDHEVKKLPN